MDRYLRKQLNDLAHDLGFNEVVSLGPDGGVKFDREEFLRMIDAVHKQIEVKRPVAAQIPGQGTLFDVNDY